MNSTKTIHYTLLRCERPYVKMTFFFFFSSRRRHTRSLCDWSSDVCSSDLIPTAAHEDTASRRPRKIQGKRWPVSRSSTIRRSEERRVGKECRSRWSPYH